MDFPPSDPLEFDDADRDWRLAEDFLQPALNTALEPPRLAASHLASQPSLPQPITRAPFYGSAAAAKHDLHDSLESNTSLLSSANDYEGPSLQGSLAFVPQPSHWAAPSRAAAFSSSSEWGVVRGGQQWAGPPAYSMLDARRTTPPASSPLSLVQLDALLPPARGKKLPGAPSPSLPLWAQHPGEGCQPDDRPILTLDSAQRVHNGWEGAAARSPTQQHRKSALASGLAASQAKSGFASLDGEGSEEGEGQGSRLDAGPAAKPPRNSCESPASFQLSRLDTAALGTKEHACQPGPRTEPSRSSSSPAGLSTGATQQRRWQHSGPAGQRAQRSAADAAALEAVGSRRLPRRAASPRVGWLALAGKVRPGEELGDEGGEGGGEELLWADAWASGDEEMGLEGFWLHGGSSGAGSFPGGGVRKKHNPWTPDETEALIEGVRVAGIGKWAQIKRLPLAAVAGVLVNRSAVDLKDKWRNLSRLARLPKTALRNRLSKSGSDTPLELVLEVRALLDSHKVSQHSKQWR